MSLFKPFYKNAFCTVAEENDIVSDSSNVVIEDWKLIETPELINTIPNIVIKPINENSIAYRFIDECISNYCITNDDRYLYDIIDEDNTFAQRHIKTGAKAGAVLGALGGAYLGKKAGSSVKLSAGGAASGAALGAFLGGYGGLEVAKKRADFRQKLYKINNKASLTPPISGNIIEEARSKGPSWIAKKIAAIKHWIKIKLDTNKEPKNQSFIKKLKIKLLSIVDKLTQILHIKSRK